MKNKYFYLARNLALIAIPSVIIACGTGSTTTNSTLPDGPYSGAITPGLNGANIESETFTASESGSVYTFVDKTTTTTTIISNGTFTNPINNNPCFTGTLVQGFSSGSSACTAGAQIQFTGCSVINNTTTGTVSFTASQIQVTNPNTSVYCYSGGSVSMNNYGG